MLGRFRKVTTGPRDCLCFFVAMPRHRPGPWGEGGAVEMAPSLAERPMHMFFQLGIDWGCEEQPAKGCCGKAGQ